MSRVADIVADADSLFMRFPKLASMKTEDGRLHLTFLNLAAELKFSVAIPLGEPWRQQSQHSAQKVPQDVKEFQFYLSRTICAGLLAWFSGWL